MKKLAIYLLLPLLLSACGDKASEKQILQKSEKPNIIFLMVDDLGKEWISCYDAENIETPQIDALAESGMIFHNAWSMPQCTPSRLTLLTGQYPFRHGWVNHWDVPRWGAGAHYDENVNPSLVKELKKAGYKTCIAGKWQIDDFRVEPDALSRNGFDEWSMWTGYETGIPASAERYQEPYIFTSTGKKTHTGKFGPDVFRDFIIDFIEKNKDTSFFVYYPMVLTHTPLVNTPDEEADDQLGKHKAMLRYTDKITGQLMAALENAGIRENTLFVWTTDNGSTRGITGSISGREIPGGKMRMLESGINSPFIASWPNVIPAGSESDALIDFSDILPTFLDLAGVESCSPGSGNCKLQGYEIDGRSFKGALSKDKNYQGRDWILAMGGGNNARRTEAGVENQFVFRDRVLRDKRYKLYIGRDRKAEKFIDLIADPDEKVNLIDSLNTEERKQSFEKLSALLPSFPPQDHDPKYKPNPPQEWDVEISAKSQEWKQ
ncbi:MAG: sulfatase-like hydrolase/transferase [Bacteroidota bacterium]